MEKKAAAPRVTTFERPTRSYATSRPVRVYQPSPSASRAGGNVDEPRPFDPFEQRFGRKGRFVFLS